MDRFILLLIFLGVAYFTNPSPETHREVTRKELTEVVNSSVNDGFINNIAKNVIIYTINEEVKASVTRENYWFFSLTKLYYEDEYTTIGFGAFTKVFISNEIKAVVRKEAKENTL